MKLTERKLTKNQRMILERDPVHYFMKDIFEIAMMVDIDWHKKTYDGTAIEQAIEDLVVRVHNRALRLKEARKIKE